MKHQLWNSLQWLIYVINSVVVLSHQRSTTVSLETYPLYARKNLRVETPKKRDRKIDKQKNKLHTPVRLADKQQSTSKKKKNWTHLSCVLTSMTWLVNNLGFPKQAFSMDTLSFITCNSNKGKCAKNTPWRALWRNEKKPSSELFLHVVG